MNDRVCPKCGKLYIKQKTYLPLFSYQRQGQSSKRIYYHHTKPKEVACVVELTSFKTEKNE